MLRGPCAATSNAGLLLVEFTLDLFIDLSVPGLSFLMLRSSDSMLLGPT